VSGLDVLVGTTARSWSGLAAVDRRPRRLVGAEEPLLGRGVPAHRVDVPRDRWIQRRDVDLVSAGQRGRAAEATAGGGRAGSGARGPSSS
jgi:hypothetical protein